MTLPADAFTGLDFCLIFAPSEGYDESEILPYSIRKFCLIGADDQHSDRSVSRIRGAA